MPDRPNILFICTDQQSASAMSCAGNRNLHTPAMDRLAAEGVRFDRAYCTFPLCSPARASLFSGRYPAEMGIPGNGHPIPASIRNQELGTLLAAGGYDCAYAGKWHVPDIAMPAENDHGFRRLAGFNDNLLVEPCIDYLRDRDGGQPFFLVASFDNPHNICEWARNQRLPWGDVEDVPVDHCPNLPANFDPGPYAPQALARERATNYRVHPTEGAAPDWWRRYRHAYFRLTEKVDSEIGRLLAALDDLSLANNTVVIFTSDHGDGHGAHQWNQKSALYEEVVRIPLIVRAPMATFSGRVEHRLASNGIDLLPTVCDYAGIDPPAGLLGRSLRPLVEDRPREPWRDWLAIETNFPPQPGNAGYGGTGGQAIIGDCYKYSVYNWGRHREQLVDLYADPGEMVNLAVESRHAERLAACREQLETWYEKIRSSPVVR